MNARYVFRVRFGLAHAGNVRVEPDEFRARVFRIADDPGTKGWLFFRDVFWRGEVNDERYARKLFSETLGVPVRDVDFRAFETDREHLDALEREIRSNLDLFKADDATEVLNKYLGSSVEVRSDGWVDANDEPKR